jgi:HlyD family secretion protein
MKIGTQKKIIGISIGILAVLILVVTFFLSRHAPAYSTDTVTVRNINQTVRTTGTIVPDQTSSLAFSTQGKIAAVNVKVGDIVHKGDVLASLDSRTIKAQLDGALADVEAAKAQLNKLEAGTRPESLAIYSQNYKDASAALLVAMNNAYVQTVDAITNKADLLFTNGNTVNPDINIRTQSQNEKTNINQELLTLNDTLTKWKNTLSSLDANNISTTSLEDARTVTKSSIVSAQMFLTNLSTIVGNLSTGNSGLSQVTINTDLGIVNGAQQEATGASNSFTTADSAWSTARDNLALQNAGTQSEDITAQEAVLAKAQAGVEGYQSALSQSVIVAPFDGTITAINAKVGEVFVPGISGDEGIDIISTNVYNVDTYVPENSIGNMNVGNPARVTFDAYGPNVVFPATVYLVNPAQTVINGANSYKVTLRFNQPDQRIRSGLTINALITTATATDVLAIPTRDVITHNDKKFVLLRDSSGQFNQQQVITGISESDGYTEIISGVTKGDVVASFGTESY